jgi:hypothetical protein
MNTKLLVFRQLLKKFGDTQNKVLTHALGLSSLVYFSSNFITSTLDKLKYQYKILEDQGMRCLVVETDEQIYISFRGTMPTQISNWKKILNFIPKLFSYGLYAHGGFVLIHNQYDSFIKTYINSLDTTKEIIFTGHSLGAAVASLYNISYTKTSKCICFASPNILFNSPFDSTSSYSYRINNDFVTWIPFSLPFLKWTIPTKTIKINSKYNGLNPFSYHALNNYIESLISLT